MYGPSDRYNPYFLAWIRTQRPRISRWRKFRPHRRTFHSDGSGRFWTPNPASHLSGGSSTVIESRICQLFARGGPDLCCLHGGRPGRIGYAAVELRLQEGELLAASSAQRPIVLLEARVSLTFVTWTSSTWKARGRNICEACTDRLTVTTHTF